MLFREALQKLCDIQHKLHTEKNWAYPADWCWTVAVAKDATGTFLLIDLLKDVGSEMIRDNEQGRQNLYDLRRNQVLRQMLEDELRGAFVSDEEIISSCSGTSFQNLIKHICDITRMGVLVFDMEDVVQISRCGEFIVIWQPS